MFALACSCYVRYTADVKTSERTLHQGAVEADRSKAAARSTRPGRSTGPRTPQGKARSARNAWRHGLSVPIRADPVWRAAVVRLERQLADEEPVRRDVARMAAEAVVELRRIALARDRLISRSDGASTIDELRSSTAMRGRPMRRSGGRFVSCRAVASWGSPSRMSVALGHHLAKRTSHHGRMRVAREHHFVKRTSALMDGCGVEAPFRKTNFRHHGWVWL
jgi:hypothetical protein